MYIHTCTHIYRLGDAGFISSTAGSKPSRRGLAARVPETWSSGPPAPAGSRRSLAWEAAWGGPIASPRRSKYPIPAFDGSLLGLDSGLSGFYSGLPGFDGGLPW